MLVTLASVAALFLVATLYLLASIPFAYYHFLQFPHFWWMPWFMQWHPAIAAAAAALLALTVPAAPAVAEWRRRYLLAAGAVVLSMTAMVLMPAAQSYAVATALCAATLLLIVCGCALGLVERRADIAAALAGGPVLAMMGSALLAALAVSAIYLGASALTGSADATLGRRAMSVVAPVSTAGHVALFVGGALLIAAVQTLGRRRRWPPLRTAGGVIAVAIAIAALVVRRVVLTALDLDESFATPLAVGIAVALVAAALRLQRRPASRVPSWLRMTVLAAGTLAAVAVLPPMIRMADWGFTLQKLLVLSAWTMVTMMVSGARRGSRVRAAVVAVGMVAAVAAATLTGAADAASTARQAGKFDLGLAVDQYATFDPSVRVVLDLARPMMSDGEYFAALRRTGEITAARRDPIPALRLADEIAPGPIRPDIYVIVVDSLRPDYLGAYNAKATFTPHIDALARESVVMTRAFTPYAGTALSEPAIWAGGLIPRLMYPEPFAPLNNLERLLDAGGYRKYISVDEILGLILADMSKVVRLDAQIAHPERKEEAFKFELCGTLNELHQRLDADRPREPVFFFTQSQNLHIRVIDTEGPHLWLERPQADTFFGPAAAAVERLDACVGRFIDYLKDSGRFANSIVVLTADHGDSYGEEGRWGHAFYVAPETLRIPLILHVPEPLLRERQWDAAAVSWLTDVTPTLFDLLGVPVSGNARVAGRPLFTRQGESRGPAPEVALVQSSYSRIYGLLDRDARWLYTVDANRNRDEFYDLAAGATAPRPITAADRIRYGRWLFEELGRLNAQYAPGAAR